MLVLLVVLAGVTVASVAALVLLVLRPPSWLALRALEVDPIAAAALDGTPRPPVAVGSTRRLISVEILNAIELAGTRGRLASIAGTLAPGLTRRIVYDQTLKILKHQLVEQQVRADVRLHVLRPPSAGGQDGTPVADVTVVDEPVDLGPDAGPSGRPARN